MSQHFKSKYDQMRENSQSTDPESQIPESSNNGPVRNICFVMEDGSMTFLNYGYLISGSIDVGKEKITLSFTSHEILLEGSYLELLFYELLHHKTGIIRAVNKRYFELDSNTKAVVSAITLKEK